MLDNLVSVIISSYNSSAFIIETLDSVAGQTWKDLELIITDDCSSDGTVELCTMWLSKHSPRFFNAKLLTATKNGGVSANANRGLHAAQGEWIKFLAADDILKPRCIEDNFAYVSSNPEVKVLFSRIEIFRDVFQQANFLKTVPGSPYDDRGIFSVNRSVRSQYRMLLMGDRIHFSPSLFINRETLLTVGGFDERFKLLEDYPLWLNLTKNGFRLYFMDKSTVCYRQHDKAINNKTISFLVNPNYFRTEDFRRLYIYPFLPADIRFEQKYTWYVSQIFRNGFLNRNNKINRFLKNMLTVYLNPFEYFLWLRKRLDKRLVNNELYFS
jgi:alpha-1,3-rhamnosyltransferase